MSTTAQEESRRAAILAYAPMVPKGACHYCGWTKIPKGALWCCADCASSYESERRDLLKTPAKAA